MVSGSSVLYNCSLPPQNTTSDYTGTLQVARHKKQLGGKSGEDRKLLQPVLTMGQNVKTLENLTSLV